MKILFSLFSCTPRKGGESGRSWNWAVTAAKLGNHVWCLTKEKERDHIEGALKNLNLPNLKFIYIKPPVYVEKLYIFRTVGMYLYYLIWQYLAYLQAKKLDKKIDFDFIQHVSWGSIQLSTMMWRLKKKLIFGPVGGGQMAPPAFKKYFMGGWRSEVFRNWASKFLLTFNVNAKNTLQNANLVLTVNRETYDLAREMGAKHIKLFMDTGLSEEAYPREYPIRNNHTQLKILFVGRLFPRRGIRLLLEALAKVENSINFSFTILGGGDHQRFLPKWINELGLVNKVNGKGQVPYAEVKDAYLNHDVFLFCSLRDSFGSQLLEAMAYGLPVITLDHMGARDFVPDDAGFKIALTTPENTVKAIADAIEYMYTHAEDRVNFGKNAYQYASTQMWSAKRSIIYEMYKELMISG